MDIYVISRKKPTQESIGRLLFYGYNSVGKHQLSPDPRKSNIFDPIVGNAPSEDFKYEVNIDYNHYVKHVYLCIADRHTIYHSTDAVECCDYLVYEDETGMNPPSKDDRNPVMVVEEIKYKDDQFNKRSRYRYSYNGNQVFNPHDGGPVPITGGGYQRAFTRAVWAKSVFRLMVRTSSGGTNAGGANAGTSDRFWDEIPEDIREDINPEKNRRTTIYYARCAPVYVMFSKDAGFAPANTPYTSMNFDYDYFPKFDYRPDSMEGFYDMLSATSGIGIIGKICLYYYRFNGINGLVQAQNGKIIYNPNLIDIVAVIVSAGRFRGAYTYNNIGTISLEAYCLRALGFAGDIRIVNTHINGNQNILDRLYKPFKRNCNDYDITLR